VGALRNQIYIGTIDNPLIYLENDEIISISGEKVVTMSGEELAIDTLTPEICIEVIPRRVFKPTDKDGIVTTDELLMCGYYGTDIKDVPYGTPVYYYHDNKYIATYYLKEAEREGMNRYKLNCVSIIGLLDMQYHAGGVYFNQTFEYVLKDILNVNRPVIPYVPASCFPLQDLYFRGSGNSSMMSKEMTSYFTTTCSFKAKLRLSELPSSDSILFVFKLIDSTESFKCYQFDIKVKTDGSCDVIMHYNNIHGATTLTENVASVFDLSEHTFEILCATDNNRVSLLKDNVVIWAKDDEEEPIALTTCYKRTWINYNDNLKFRLYSEVVACDGINIINYIPCMTEDELSIGFYNSVENPDHTFVMYSTSLLTIPVLKGLKYVDRGEPFKYWEDIMIDEDVKDVIVNGWLPYDTCRNNLHQLMFALNVIMLKSDLGKVILTFPVQEEATQIPDQEVFDKGSVRYVTPASKVEVTEHTFKANASVDPVILFDNTGDDEVDHELIKFSQAPVDTTSRTTTGQLDVEEMGVNYAVVSGRGTLSAKPYVHSKKLIKKINPNATTEHVVPFSNATLVNSLNSQNVAKRMINYYMSNETVVNKIMLGERKCGNRYQLTNRFGEPVTGYLSKVSFNPTSFMGADCEFIKDYTPNVSGNNYEHSVILTGNGTWQVPTGVTEIRVTLISGGQGGESGYAGTSGSSYNGGQGGRGGDAGKGGRIRELTMGSEQPYPLGSSYVYSCGVGGNGGSECSNHSTNNTGSLGTDTTFGAYSTADYVTQDYGYTDIKTGIVYALEGEDGTDGGDGGKGDRANDSTAVESHTYVIKGIVYNADVPIWIDSNLSNVAENGEDTIFNGLMYNGGNGYGFSIAIWDDYYDCDGQLLARPLCGGGGGGGAAAEKDAGNGSAPIKGRTWSETQNPSTGYTIQTMYYEGTSGNGGNGATPNARTAATLYGNGGDGGHGGGGGGGAGKITSTTVRKKFHDDIQDIPGWYYDRYTIYKQANLTQGTPGSYGRGGAGGKGGNGCIIIQY